MEKLPQPNPTKFVPNVYQLAFADAYIQTHGSIREAFELIQRDRSIYYDNWRHQEGFASWLNESTKAEVLKRTGKWYLLLEKFAEKGSFRHLDRLLVIAEKLVPYPEMNNRPSSTFVFTSCVKCVKNEPHECKECVKDGVIETPPLEKPC